MNLVAIQNGAQDAAGLLIFLVVLIERGQGLRRLGWLELPSACAVPLDADNAGFDIAAFFQGGGGSVRAPETRMRPRLHMTSKALAWSLRLPVPSITSSRQLFDVRDVQQFPLRFSFLHGQEEPAVFLGHLPDELFDEFLAREAGLRASQRSPSSPQSRG